MSEKESCIFCRIIDGEIPSDKVYEDDAFVAIRDVNPQAPIHVLVIPKRHVANILEASGDGQMMAGIFKVVNKVAEKLEMKVDGPVSYTHLDVYKRQVYLPSSALLVV